MSLPDFGVYSIAPLIPSAMKYYRLEVPLRTMQGLGLSNVFMPDADTEPELSNQVSMGADVILVWRLTGRRGYDYAKVITDLKPKEKEGVPSLYPPILMMDSDDALDRIHPFNAAFSDFGVRDWQGNLLEPGDSIVYPLKDGSEKVLWEDKKTSGQGIVFDIERNLQNMSLHYTVAGMAAGMTVTTEELAKVYRAEMCENVYVFPNSVIPEDYPSAEMKPSERLRILWEGGNSHIDAWMSIKTPLLEILRENPNVMLVAFGALPQGMEKEIAENQLELHSWIDYAAYKYKRVMLNCQINLCPLTDNNFNRCKSAIRWYEGCMAPIPEVALAADVGPYKEIKDGITGLTYSSKIEFKQKLQMLIDDKTLRRRLGDAAKEWVLTHRAAERTVPGLFEFYKEMKARQKRKGDLKLVSTGAV